MDTLFDLTDMTMEEAQLKVEFFKINNVWLFEPYTKQNIDYIIFIYCQRLYEETGLNYFERYNKFRISEYKPLIKYYEDKSMYSMVYFDESIVRNYYEDTKSILEDMKFFGIGQFYDVTLDDLEDKILNISNEINALKQHLLNKSKVKKELKSKEAQELVNRYMTFNEFDNSKFNQIFNEYISNIDKNTYTLDEVIELSIEVNMKETFVVIFHKDDKVMSIGRTKNLITYIGSKFKENDSTSVSFYAIEDEYVDEIYVKSIINFNVINVNNNMVKTENKKYTKLTIARKVYNELYQLNLNHIKKVVKLCGIEQNVIADGIVVDKIELDKAIRGYLSIK